MIAAAELWGDMWPDAIPDLCRLVERDFGEQVSDKTRMAVMEAIAMTVSSLVCVSRTTV